MTTTPREAVARLTSLAKYLRNEGKRLRSADFHKDAQALEDLFALLNPQEGAEGDDFDAALIRDARLMVGKLCRRRPVEKLVTDDATELIDRLADRLANAFSAAPAHAGLDVNSPEAAQWTAELCERTRREEAHAGLVETIAPFVKAAQFVTGWPADWPDDDYGCVDKIVVDAITIGQWRALAALSATLYEGGET